MALVMELAEVQLKGDPAYLEKVWENLLSNALKYTEVGGEIDICLLEETEEVKFAIKDNGSGIAEQNVSRLFDRFYRVDNSRTQDVEGTGLGLSIVHQIVKLHGGRVEIDSEEGIGTTFTVLLPKL